MCHLSIHSCTRKNWFSSYIFLPTASSSLQSLCDQGWPVSSLQTGFQDSKFSEKLLSWKDGYSEEGKLDSCAFYLSQDEVDKMKKISTKKIEDAISLHNSIQQIKKETGYLTKAEAEKLSILMELSKSKLPVNKSQRIFS